MKTRKQKVSMLWCVLLVLCRVTLSAETTPDVRGFSQSGFDYSFSRADQALDPEAWMLQARQGISLARSNWERIALTLYQDEAERTAAGNALDRWSQEEIQSRFAQWLERRFFAEQGTSLVWQDT